MKSWKSASCVTLSGSPLPSSMTENVITLPAAMSTETVILVADADANLTAFVSPLSTI